MASKRIAVAMSGGVDSSVSAALLAEQHEDVFGIMLRLWTHGTAESNRCCTPADVQTAKQVANELSIPFYIHDVKQAFYDEVVEPFIHGYANGVTPNPCVFCNRKIRWGVLLQHAIGMGATHLATGHYARVLRQGNRHKLLRAADRDKDQSYVLSVLNQSQLAQTIFPLGDMTKTQVREYAVERGFSSAHRSESQDLCFIGDLDYRAFLRESISGNDTHGPIQTISGENLGQHRGLQDYTIGQRKGLGISWHEPLYVLTKDVRTNTLTVGSRADLEREHFMIDSINLVSGKALDAFQANVQVRYKATEVPAKVVPTSERTARVELDSGLNDITPGQLAVFYQRDECIGSGRIVE